MHPIDIHDESIWMPQAQMPTVTHSHEVTEDDTPVNPSRELDHEFMYGYF